VCKGVTMCCKGYSIIGAVCKGVLHNSQCSMHWHVAILAATGGAACKGMLPGL